MSKINSLFVALTVVIFASCGVELEKSKLVPTYVELEPVPSFDVDDPVNAIELEAINPVVNPPTVATASLTVESEALAATRTVTFPKTKIGEWSVRFVSISNREKKPMLIQVEISGSSDFTADSSVVSVAPESATFVMVTYKPSFFESTTARLSVFDTRAGMTREEIVLKGSFELPKVIGKKCGSSACSKDEYCCNSSCGICAPKDGGVCSQQVCLP